MFPNSTPPPGRDNILDSMHKQLEKGIKNIMLPEFEPSGIQDKAIIAFGENSARIIKIQAANKIGKTALDIIIFREIIYPSKNKFFQFPIFQNFPYPKHLRFATDATLAKEDGPLFTEINKWWPQGRYTVEKGGKHYFSTIRTDTGFVIDIMTFEQKGKQYEGSLLGGGLIDEPPEPWMIGSFLSRMSEGGILLVTFTPIEFEKGSQGNVVGTIDAIDDMAAGGTRVVSVSAGIDDNDSETGIPNRFGTKRGNMTPIQIAEYKATIPVDERAARLRGVSELKLGRVFPKFSEDAHVINQSLTEFAPTLKMSNLYMSMDPHEKYYPFMVWGAVTPIGDLVIWNEWPTYYELRDYYHKIRRRTQCNYSYSQLGQVIKIYDGIEFGFQIKERAIDPRFAVASVGKAGSVKGIIAEFSKPGVDVDFTIPKMELIATRRNQITELLEYNNKFPVGPANKPKIYILAHCINMIRAFKKHYWGKEDEESEEHKDAIDALRYLLSIICGGEGIHYIAPQKEDDQPMNLRDDPDNDYSGLMKDTSLS